jgi:gamma-glutamyltranspeptidase/glutathione hydrolase
MLEMAHRQHGRLPWADLVKPAITLAIQGFKISPRLHTLLKNDRYLRLDPAAAAYFYDTQGHPHPVGHVLKNPELAAVLQQIGQHGAQALLEGATAQAMVQKIRQHPTNPGRMQLSDLSAYQALQRQPLCHRFSTSRQNYRICGFPPPSSGALAIGQILGMLQHTPAATLPLEEQGPNSAWLHFYTEAARLAFADRAQYVADPDFASPPAKDWSSLLAPDYLRARAALIGPRAMPSAPAGTPGNVTLTQAPMPEQHEFGTSHISIVDAQGHAVAMTSTIEDAFGARMMVQGFLLNNQLTDFSFTATGAEGAPIANRVQPGKRPRSSMSPTFVFDADTGKLLLVTGSAGGAMIIHDTVKMLWSHLQWQLSPQQAANLPNFGAIQGPALLETGRFPASTRQALENLGHRVHEIAITSGVHAIQVTPSGLISAADPRREGHASGQ